MENRSIGKFILLSLITLGIYLIFWHFWVTKELRNAGQDVPTAWLQFIPFANLYFLFKFYQASENVTNRKVHAVLYFVIAILISPWVSSLLIQNELNHTTTATAGMPQQPNMNPQPHMPPSTYQMPGTPTAPMGNAPAAPAQPPAQDHNQQPPIPPAPTV